MGRFRPTRSDPRRSETPANRARSVDLRPSVGQGGPLLQGANILVFTDDDALSGRLREVLVQSGAAVACAGTVEAAHAQARACVPDLLIVDHFLASANGIDMIRAFQRSGVAPPAILISGLIRDAASFFQLKRELGIRRLLRKPIDSQLLLAQIEVILDPDVDGQARWGTGGPGLPAPDTAESSADPLEKLRVSFEAQAPERVAALKRSIIRVREGEADLAEAVVRESHRLHGTCGSYGFSELGRAAGALESVFETIDEAGGVVAPEVWEEVDRAVEWLQSSVGVGDIAVGGSRSHSVVLVAEDDDDVIRLVQRQSGGLVRIEVGRTIDEALTRAAVSPPDCAIIDTHLDRRQGGIDLARQLRDLPGLGTLPIAFVSADDSLEAQLDGIDAGGSIYLSKPIHAHEFPRAIEQLTTRPPDAPARILLIDDDTRFTDHAEALLTSQGFSVFTLHRSAEVMSAIEQTNPDIILVDKDMPGLDGIEICRVLRADPRKQDLPILLVTADTRTETRVAAFRAGADDYVPKPVVDEELIARVRTRIERLWSLRERAMRDSLTGLLLRTPFIEAAQRALSRAQRAASSVVFGMIDVDHFKRVNDDHGHLAGDRVLADLGALLLRRFRREDLRCRWGGEEILVVIPDATVEVAARAFERVLREFRALRFTDSAGEVFEVTFSAGVCAFPQGGTTIDALIARADERLYQAKKLGRARVVR